MKDRNSKDRVVFKCIQSKANIEIYMGEKENYIFNIRMIDKIIYSFFGLLDKFSEHLDRVFFPKPKKRKKKCKDCKCDCHCKDDLHINSFDQELCNCEGCKH